jgi:hypothetical protein
VGEQQRFAPYSERDYRTRRENAKSMPALEGIKAIGQTDVIWARLSGISGNSLTNPTTRVAMTKRRKDQLDAFCNPQTFVDIEAIERRRKVI